MTQPFRAADHLGRLKDFQRQTVRHVVDRMYDGDSPTRRFLVADETGLGKSVVARGVVAEAIERLLVDDTVKRIDVVYVCSNADIAAQNLGRLNVVGNNRVEFRSRLTMLAVHSHDLNSPSEAFGKPVNLIAFTPATSFEKGWRTGKGSERALLAVLLRQSLDLSRSEDTAMLRALQHGIRDLDRFRNKVAWYADQDLDATIAVAFTTDFRSSSLVDALTALISDIGRKQSLDSPQWERSVHLIGELRTMLAKASVHALEPDLIILDEFQRFRHLLDLEKGGEAAELAHQLFEWEDARTLLLSATPYKPFTLDEEDESGEDHYSDLMTTLGFLSSGNQDWLQRVRSAFSSYRSRLLAGQSADGEAAALRLLLLQYMCRTERPLVAGAHREVATVASKVMPRDLQDFVGLRALGRAVGSAVQLEYWKSAPYFVNYLEGYQVGERLKQQLKAGTDDPALHAALTRVSAINPDSVASFAEIDMGNARLRSLAERTVGAGWWQLLWVPPSMPYLDPAGPYAEAAGERVTKQLVFSSWSATPTAIASLLSYDAERQLAEGSTRLTENTAEARRRVSTLLTYRVTGGQAAAMSTLALFWPHPGLAPLTDPLAYARDRAAGGPDDTPTRWALRALGAVAEGSEQTAVADYFAWPGLIPKALAAEDATVVARLMQGGAAEDDEPAAESTRLDVHVEEALASTPARRASAELAELALHAPGNVAWRALRRLVNERDDVSDRALWSSAAQLANGLRSLFNRLESNLLLERLYPDLPYWRAVLAYSAAGNLQAVLDEYLHHLRSSAGDEVFDDDSLARLAAEAASVLSMRPSRYVAFNPSDHTSGIGFGARFALRYGSARGATEDVRMPEVRAAFNSPFWPFVLTSTSVGQEGIDFHWWCHSVVHWNTPASPVDFEQREGRVNRFGGHAVRRNIALAHRDEALRSETSNPWDAAYAAAAETQPELGDFCPYWVYPGPHAVERHLLPFPLSQDGPRAESLKRDLTHYRLALGQPRQEDFLALLAKHGEHAGKPVDLRPPR